MIIINHDKHLKYHVTVIMNPGQIISMVKIVPAPWLVAAGSTESLAGARVVLAFFSLEDTAREFDKATYRGNIGTIPMTDPG